MPHDLTLGYCTSCHSSIFRREIDVDISITPPLTLTLSEDIRRSNHLWREAMNICNELDSIELSTATASCESGLDIVHPAFVNVLTITIVIL